MSARTYLAAARLGRTISTGKRRLFAAVPPQVSLALIGTRCRELVEQMAFATHDLDAVAHSRRDDEAYAAVGRTATYPASRSVSRARSSSPVCIDPLTARLRSVVKPRSKATTGLDS